MKTSHEELCAIVRMFRPGADVGPLVPLKGGISSGVAAFDVTTDAKTEQMVLREPGEWALKQNPHAAKDEFKLLSILHSQGIPAPQPVHHGVSADRSPFLIVGYIEGELIFKPTHMSSYIGKAAQMMARVHGLDSALFDFLPGVDAHVSNDLQQALMRPAAEPLGDRICETLKAARPVPSNNKRVVTHGDLWPGNLLWKGGEITAVIDWEDAALGEPLYDVAISRLEMLFAFGSAAMEEFTQTYHSITWVDLKFLPYWDLCAALGPLDNLSDWAGFWPDFDRPDVTEATMHEDHNWFVEQALERIA